jgi:hypothetical protein
MLAIAGLTLFAFLTDVAYMVYILQFLYDFKATEVASPHPWVLVFNRRSIKIK